MTESKPAHAPQFDTGPLSWVLGEIRDALERSAKALQDAAGRSPEAQPTLLLHAKSHLHQAHGALQMVDVNGVEHLTGSAEQVIDRFKDGSLLLDGARAATVGDAYRALVEYLEELVDARGAAAQQPVRLFPYYRLLQELLGAERVHPGDMLALDLAPALLPGGAVGPAPDYAASRAQFEKALLFFLRSTDPDTQRSQAGAMRDALAPVTRVQADPLGHAFWLALQTVADLVAQGEVASDLYVKQLFGQINLQLRRMAQGHTSLPDALLRDALFFVAQAETPTADARLLREAWRIDGQVPRDYLERRYGRIDPAALKDAKAALIETKQGLDRIAHHANVDGAVDPVEDGFDAALSKLAGASEKLGAPALAQLLRELGQAASESAAGAPSAELQMEMAQAMLFVEHGLDQVRQLPEDFGQHAEAVGQRLLALAHGETPPALPQWQGDLAREMQQDETVAALAGEMRTSLRQIEKLVDEYYDNPARTAALLQADPLLHQLQGALAILDQDHATRAVVHVREAVRQLAAGTPDAATRTASLDELARNIGALGFFTDAMAQDVDSARRRFRFDEAAQLFVQQPFDAHDDAAAGVTVAAAAPAPVPEAAPVPALAAASMPALPTEAVQAAEAASSAEFAPAADAAPPAGTAPATGEDAIEAELLEIFIAEAGEVLALVGATLPALHGAPDNQETLTRLRRSFHTLKGSSRMVGLDAFALGAAAVEKTMNLWLAEGRAATPALLDLLAHAHADLSDWVAELAAQGRSGRSGEPLAAAAARVQAGEALALDVAPEAATEVPPDSVPDVATEVSLEAAPAVTEPEAEPEAAAAPLAPVAAAPALPEDVAELLLDMDEPLPVAAPEAPPDTLKRIGELAIPLPLYDIYLNETAGLVDTLAADVAAWRPAPARAVSEAALKAAHTLGGTSSTVGFAALQDIAVALEAVLQMATPPLADPQFDLLDETVERVRTMLQVFALGELAPPQPDLLARLDALREELGRPRADAAPADIDDVGDTVAAVDEVGDEVGDTTIDADAAVDAESALAAQLDALFAAAYDSILAAPPPAGDTLPAPDARADATASPRQADAPHDPAVAEVDDLFDSYFGDAYAAPSLEQAQPEAAPVAAAEDDLDALFEAAAAPASAPASGTASAEATPETLLADPVASAEPTSDAAAEAPPADELSTELTAELATEPVFTDELDPDLLPVFMEEATDLLPQIGDGLRRWQQNPLDTGAAQGLLRALHTVKGSARMAGAMRLGQHTHALETQIENMLHAGTTSAAAFDELLVNYDQAQLLFEQLQQPAVEAASDSAAPEAAAVDPAAVDTAPGAAADGPQPARTPLVRVRADILDRLVNQAGEVSITRSKLETQVGTLKGALSDFSDNLARMRQQLREIEMQAESQIASRLSIAGEREFDPLEFDRFTRLQELTRMMAESVNDVGSFHDSMARTVDAAGEDLAAQSRLTRELQRDLMRARMVPFASLSERLFRLARQTAKETDKRVNLDIRGGAVEIDRSVLERMAAPFEHLLRNAIVHGVEPRSDRVAAGKAETGELLIQVSQQGNEVVIRVGDDGAGLDIARIRAKADALGLVAEGEALSDQDAAALIFEPGFSTAEALTELAGRGVGMDVVRSEARALGGRVDIQTRAGHGAAFTIHLPLTLAATQVVLVASGTRTHAVPSVLVEQLQQVREADLAAARAVGSLRVQGEDVPLHYLPELLREPGGAGGQRSYPVLILKSGTARMALQVDEVLGNREVVVKNIGPQLARMPGIAGATVLGSGEIVLILNPVLLAGQGTGSARGAAPASGAPVPHLPTVMVVDDSMTVRRVTQRLLEREDYRVLLAKDGLDALEQMQETRPDLMLVDIEMPRMDGFDLTRHVRGNEATQSIPIIMITSRSADKHRNYALDLGVDAYFGKPFQEEMLLAAMAGLLGREMPVV